MLIAALKLPMSKTEEEKTRQCPTGRVIDKMKMRARKYGALGPGTHWKLACYGWNICPLIML